MKKLLITSLSVCCVFLTQAQISGTKTVGAAFGRDYPTIDSAINHLNTVGLNIGGVIFEVDAGHTETLTAQKQITTVTSTALAPVVFRKAGFGANPLITGPIGTSTTLDGIITIVGSDYITFDGIDLQERTTNTTSTTRMEWGYGILKPTGNNGCTNITIRNCSITLNKANTASKGIYVANHTTASTTSLTISNTSGIPQFINLTDNRISNSYLGISALGSSSVTYYNDSINIIGNVITNFGGSSTTAIGILASSARRLTIANDSIIGGTGNTSTTYGISAESSTGANVRITGNYVSLLTNTTSSNVIAIRNTAGSSGDVQIAFNTIANCASSTMTTGSFNGINNSASTTVLNIHDNIISNNSRSSSTGSSSYISTNSTIGTANVFNNQIFGNTITAVTTGGTFGINVTGGAIVNVYDNTIHSNSIVSTTTSSHISTGIQNNAGITVNMFRNKIYGYTSTSAGTTISGILLPGSSASIAINVSNNLIGNSSALASINNNSLNGINLTSTWPGTTYSIHHNTIFLQATSTGANFGSNGISCNTLPPLSLIGNLIVNLSTPNGTGRTVAYLRSDNNMVNYSSSSNFNSFFCGIPSASNLIYADNVNSFQTLNAYQRFQSLGAKDQASVTVNPLFLSTLGSSSTFLMVDSSSGSQLESGSIQIPGLLGDFSNVSSRSSFPRTGQSNGGGTLPDIGAYEQDFIPKDSSGPEIIFTPLLRGSVFASRQLNNVVIRDRSGVRRGSTVRPRLYYKTRAQGNVFASANNSSSDGWKFVEPTNTNSPFNFVIDYSLLFGGVVSLNDTIEYFIVAADSSVNNNIKVAFASLSNTPTSTNLTSVEFPVIGVTNFYAIDTALLSSYTIGGTGTVDFTSLTRADGLFNAINNGVVSGIINISVNSDVLNENGAVALETLNIDGPNPANAQVVIAPGNSNITLSGSFTGGLIQLRNTSNITINGTFSGLPHQLNIINTATTGSIAALQIASNNDNPASKDITIMNCKFSNGNRTNTSGHAIFIGGTSITTSNSSGGSSNSTIRILNNQIFRAAHGITITSTTSNGADSISIMSNEIGSFIPSDYIGAYGIRINGLNRGLLKSNNIYNIRSTSTNINTLNGISCINTRTTNIDGNNIDNIIFSGSQVNTVVGIHIACNSNANVVIKNNEIKRIVASGDELSVINGPSGILLNGLGNDYKIYNNTVHLTGNRPVNTWLSSSGYYTYLIRDAYSTAMAISSSSITGLDIRNNIFSNRMTSSATNPGSNFAFYTQAPSANFTHLSHNTYIANSTTSAIFNGFYVSGNSHANLSNFKAALPIDRYSVFGNVPFTNDTTLTLLLTDTNVWNVSGRAMPLTSVNMDINGNIRSTAVSSGATDAGAHEFGVPSSLPPPAVEVNTPSLGGTSFYLLSQDTIAKIEWASTSLAVPSSVQLRYYPGINPTAPPVGTKFMNAKWLLDGNITSGLNYKLTLYYSPANLGTVPNESNLRMAQYNSVWVPYTSTTTLNTTSKTMEVSGLTNLIEYTGTDAVSALPVQLETFTAKMKNKTDIEVIWNTASEINASHFIVERSFDGTKFNLAGEVKARNNSAGSKYQFVDEDIVKVASKQKLSTVYYRLVSADFDGSTEYSPTERVYLKEPMPIEILTTNPNPFTDNIEVSFTSIDSEVLISIADINGKVLFTNTYQAEATEVTTLQIPVEKEVPAGFYFITIDSKSGRQTAKIIKQ